MPFPSEIQNESQSSLYITVPCLNTDSMPFKKTISRPKKDKQTLFVSHPTPQPHPFLQNGLGVGLTSACSTGAVVYHTGWIWWVRGRGLFLLACKRDTRKTLSILIRCIGTHIMVQTSMMWTHMWWSHVHVQRVAWVMPWWNIRTAWPARSLCPTLGMVAFFTWNVE